jgi:hypothetical protein
MSESTDPNERLRAAAAGGLPGSLEAALASGGADAAAKGKLSTWPARACGGCRPGRARSSSCVRWT